MSRFLLLYTEAIEYAPTGYSLFYTSLHSKFYTSDGEAFAVLD